MRSVSFAMAGAVLPGMQCVQGQTLSDYKTNMRNHLQAQATLESNHCIACAKSEGTTCYYSPGGRNEYERTGVCERIACSIPRLPCKKSSNSAIN